MKRLNKFIQQIILKLILGWSWFNEFRKANKSSLVSASMNERIWAFRKGFFLETVKFFNINNNNYPEYLSDRYYKNLHPINKTFSRIIDNKLYLPYLLKDYPENVPQYFCFIENGRFINLNPWGHQIINNTSLLEIIKKRKKLVLKPCSSSLGKGFNLLEWDEGNIYLNKSVINFKEFMIFIKSLNKYIISEFVAQHKYAFDINPSSTNTVRLLCVLDVEKNKFFIPRASHRFGIEGKLIDNIGDGGIGASIDITSGIIKNKGLIKEKGKPAKLSNISVHPDSKMPIAGVQIPHWESIVRQVPVIMNNISFIKYAGIDVVVTENGFKIIEINSLPTLLPMQFEEGLLKDERLEKFFGIKNKKESL